MFLIISLYTTSFWLGNLIIGFWGPSPELIVYTCYADRFEPRSRISVWSLASKSPNTPGGISAKALTPLSQPVKVSRSFRLVSWLIYFGRYVEIWHIFWNSNYIENKFIVSVFAINNVGTSIIQQIYCFNKFSKLCFFLKGKEQSYFHW